MENILDFCFPSVLTKEILDMCEPFSCGDNDMDEFFYQDALEYTQYRMGKSYCFRLIENPNVIVACFTVSNDSIRLFDLGSSKKNRMWKEISGCRLAIVDAKNEAHVLSFYEKNDFKYLFKSESDEFAYMHQHEQSNEVKPLKEIKLNTRLMYCDLLS